MKKEFHGRRTGRSGFAGRSLMTLALVFSLIVTLPFLSNAAENDGGREGSVTVSAANADEFPDLAEAELVIDLYKVAEVSMVDDGYSYQLVAPYTGLVIPDVMNSDRWRKLSQEAAKITLDTESGSSRQEPYKTGATQQAIGELEPGLYLLVVRNNGATDYVTTTKDGADIVTRVSSDAHTYTFLPELVSLPTKEPDANGVVNTDNPGDWIYDIEVTLKPEQELNNGSLKIVKTLQGSNTGKEPETFVFDVEAVLDGVKVYSDVVTMVFNGPGVQELLIENIPIGATVTVTEVYSGARCTLVTSGTQTVTIAADEIVSVAFTNKYDGNNGGGSITNHFRHEADGWKLDQLYDKSQR
ncbi:MAG: hypothetical protein HDR18_14555 [Lachnospiraceae bacterium]|nr:hypothetical protein [Lachnospiraceae bacterium]